MTTGWANAAVATNAIDAGGTSLAGLRRALVHVDATVRTGESLGADASKPSGSRLTRTTVVTRLSAALVNGLVAKESRPAGGAAAVRLQGLIRGTRHAGSTVLALTSITACGTFRTAFA